MDLNRICEMTKSPAVLNALHACRPGHPWNVPGINHFRNALFSALQRPSYEINSLAIDWLKRQADAWDRANGRAA